jgi:HAE1 family hydrophobic/amphiphilic exporter-1
VVPLYRLVPQDYIPSDVDEGEFEIDVKGPESAGAVAMDLAMQAVESDLMATPGVRTVLATVGGSYLNIVASGSIFVRIEPHAQRRFTVGRLFEGLLAGDPGRAFRGNYTQREVMTQIRRQLGKYPDLRCMVRNQRSFNIGGGGFEIDFALRGPELQALVDYGNELRLRAAALGTMVDLDNTLRLSRPELRVEIDRPRAAELGVDTQDIAFALRLMVGGDQETSRFRDPQLDEEYDVRLRLRERDRNDVATFGGLLVPRASGPPVRLDNLVHIGEAMSAARIDRVDRQRQNSLRGSVSPGAALADCTQALRRIAADLHMPAEYTTAIYGRARELEKTFDEFVLAFILSLAFMYMILAAQFESVWQPAIILLALPAAAPFALISLLLAHETLNLYSALGVLVLFGMVKKNSILQIDHQNQLLREGLPLEQAIVQGSRDRLRPILMTTLAFVAGMLPLAIGTGPGAEERKAISVVVIGGQMLSLVLSLLLTPVAYKLLLQRTGIRALHTH